MRKTSRLWLVSRIVAGALVLVLLLCVGGFALLDKVTGGDNPSAVRTAAANASTGPDGPALAAFEDPELKDFARIGANKAQKCEKYTEKIDDAKEAKVCSFAGGNDILYVRFTSQSEKNTYRYSARTGFDGHTVKVDEDTHWANSEGEEQGVFITGVNREDDTRYLYWDSDDAPVSAQVFTDSKDEAATEKFWNDHH